MLNGASAITAAIARAVRGRSRGEREGHERDRPEDEQRRVEQVQEVTREPVDRAFVQAREVVKQHRILELHGWDQLGHEPQQRQRRQTQAADHQRALCGGPA